MNPGRIRSNCVAGLLLACLAACRMPGTGESTVPPTTLPVEIGSGTPVGVTLVLLEAQLDSALAAGLDGAGPVHLDRAEAISDRLLETRLPFAWISAESYSVEARLRQIQVRADRVEALRLGGARGEDVTAEIRQLREAVAVLRRELDADGTPAPPPVQQLLSTLDTARRR
jgi:hypothetical protein